MEIRVLVEDTSSGSDFRSEHGLSLYIETQGIKILFDMGASDLFLENARKMGIEIADIDLAVISHGHYDHGGGLRSFLEKNEKAKVYINGKAFENHYSKAVEQYKYIGLDKDLQKNSRIVLTNDVFPISDNLILFSNVAGDELLSSCNSSLYAKKSGSIEPDDFEHEQSLLIKENDKLVLIAGCAHRGIVNIIKSSIPLKCRQPDYVIGGLHLYNHSKGISEDAWTVNKIGDFLKETGSMCYTGHCTGAESYYILKKTMGAYIQYLSTGSVVKI
jgi:7,8-dihydropterin-6-yl-methyl-4-(beta-D-ribofuranosyl)aminobenzene 5'-phosphate synthase